MTITCPENNTVCDTVAGAGAGLGIFIQYMGEALPALLIILVFVGVIGAVGYGVGRVVANSIKITHK